MKDDDNSSVEVSGVAASASNSLSIGSSLAGLDLSHSSPEHSHDITEVDWGRRGACTATDRPVAGSGGWRSPLRRRRSVALRRGLYWCRSRNIAPVQVGESWQLATGPTYKKQMSGFAILEKI